MPTTYVNAFSARKLEPLEAPQDLREMNVSIQAAGQGLTVELARGTVLGQVAATGEYKAYSDADGLGEGIGVARGILLYDISVDDAGHITYTTTAGATPEWGQTYDTVPMAYAGTFNVADLTGLDANGAADLGRLVSGDATAGILRMG